MRFLVRGFCLLLLGCNGRPPIDPSGLAAITVAGKTYRLEFVATREGRKELARRDAPDHALLVLHARPRYHHYDTSGRYDVLFLDEEGNVLEIQSLQGQEGGITSTVECRAALLLPPGSGARKGEAISVPEFKIAGEEFSVLRVGPHEVFVEQSETWEERQQGLMWRRRMSKDDGMLFVYSESQMRRFWMGNTYLDLDIAFFREDRTLLNVVEMKKYPDPSVDPGDRARSEEPARYVLEMNLGWFRERGLTDPAGRPFRPLAFEFVR